MVMVQYADLEIGLHHRTSRTCSVELRFNHPESAADQVLATGDSRVRFDLGKLQEQVFNPASYGRVLSKSLFVPAVERAFDTARTLAQSDDLPLRVRLRIGPSAPELHGLWWETLRDPKDGSALLMDQSILFSRYLSSLDSRPVVIGSKSELRALVAIANPSDLAEFEADERPPLPPIDVAGELDRVRRALGGMQVTALASGGTATLDRMIEELRKGHDILYLVCHGYLAEGESQVLLEDSTGRVHRVSGVEFIDALRDLQRPPRLVVLASCQSAGRGEEASSDEHGALAALGPRMAETGIPAVLAMQGRVSMQTMEQFIPVFFKELDRDGQIDRAMTLARAAVRHRHDWWVPVLFMRLKTGRFWYPSGFVGGGDVRRLAGLCNEIRRERCTALLGPGLADAFMSRQEIARGWAGQYHYPMAQHYRDDLPHVAQYLTVEEGPNLPRDNLLKYLRKELLERYGRFLPEGAGRGSLDALITAVGTYRRSVDRFEPHAVLARLPFKVFITIDPTDMLADALKAEGKDPQVELCPWKDEVIWPESIFDDPTGQYEPSSQRPLVYHLFGHLRDPDTLVLTEDDYFDYLIGVTKNKELIPETIRRAFTSSALLFLGFRLDEWDFRVLFRSIMSQEGKWLNRRYPHVAAQINPDEGRMVQPDRARRYLESYFSQLDQIQVSIFWGSVEDFVRRLSDCSQEDMR